jgi:hypothetical protein
MTLLTRTPEHVLEAAQERLDENPRAMRQRHAKDEDGATHFLMKHLPKVAHRDGAAGARL